MGICPARCRSNLTTLENPTELVSTAHHNMIISLYDYPANSLAALTVNMGEKLFVISDDGDFMMVKSTTTGCESYIPSHYTAKVTDRWLFTGISRYKAEELLMLSHNRTGAFLIRESETNRGCYSLSVVRRANSSYLDCVKHYRINHLQNGWFYISQNLTFPTLHHLVEHYCEFTDGLCDRLREPCFVRGSNSRETMYLPTAVRNATLNWKDISRSMIFRRKRTESENSLVSEGLREAITSYLQMTECNGQSWDT
ncbi:src-like-adapter 2 [Genypterus blacodes]|uniref:src-like-adapter 2 n=1 Tax=Genypterus blacodes TaxID=154954 RepID=UPI003F75D707